MHPDGGNNMDLMSIMSAMMGGSSTSGISQATGTSSVDVSSILAAALPALLSGAGQQASNASTATSFAQALEDHASVDTTNIASFFNNVDLDDGSKIVNHLLGSDSTATTKAIAKEAGVTQKQATAVLSAAAPYLMSLIGQQTASQTQAQTTQAAKTNTTSSLMSSLLSNVDIGSLAGTLLSSAVSTNTATTKKTATSKKSSGVDLSDGLDVNDVVGILGKLLK